MCTLHRLYFDFINDEGMAVECISLQYIVPAQKRPSLPTIICYFQISSNTYLPTYSIFLLHHALDCNKLRGLRESAQTTSNSSRKDWMHQIYQSCENILSSSSNISLAFVRYFCPMIRSTKANSFILSHNILNLPLFIFF